MKTNKLFPLALALFFIAILSTQCTKPMDSVDEPNTLEAEELSESDALFLEGLPPAKNFSASEIVLPNGLNLSSYLKEVDTAFHRKWLRGKMDVYEDLGPQDARNLLIARLTSVALNLTDRSKHQFKDPSTGKVIQNGLAYSWGGKDHQKKEAPKGEGTICNHSIYGLDCSGFVYQLFKQSGVNLPDGKASNQSNPEVLQRAIQLNIPALDKIKVEAFKQKDMPVAKFQSGDLIYWKYPSGKIYHIGVVLKNKFGQLAVFMSSGYKGISQTQCDENLSEKRGPKQVSLTDPKWFENKEYGITRINADISGKWTLYMRCEGLDKDAIVLNLEFPTTQSKEFSVRGAGKEYDGSDLMCNGKFRYDNSTNNLSGTLHITSPSLPGFYRYDSFELSLKRDITPYSKFILGDNVDAGCEVEGRLKNNE